MKVRRFRRFGLALMAPVIVVTASAIPASAGPPEWHYSFEFDGAEETLCGMTARLDGFVHGTFHEKQRRDGTVLGTFNEHYSIRYTNVATGRWLLTEFNGINTDRQVIDEGDGIITVISAVAGIERVYTPDGTLVFKAAGTTLRAIRIDLMDPDDPDDDVVLDDRVVKRAGLRHGAADCDALRALMG